MKTFLVILWVTFSLGTALSLNLRQESLLFALVYIFTVYHIYRINITEAFFLTFSEKLKKEERTTKVRLGPTEVDLKTKSEKNEDLFVELFDWRKDRSRKVVSTVIFTSAIYFLFFRLKVEAEMGSVLAVVSAFFLMQAVSVGHILFPLGLNLLSVLLALHHATTPMFILFPVYGLLFIMNLALIFPSEERFLFKLKEWASGKFSGVVLTFLFLAAIFTLGYFLFHDLDFTRHPPIADKTLIEKHLTSVKEKRAVIKSATATGLLNSPGLLNQFNSLSMRYNELKNSEKPNGDSFDKLTKREELLNQTLENALKDGPAPALTPELKDYMKGDLESRSPEGLDSAQYEKMQQLSEKLDQENTGPGTELVKEFRALKYCENGYYSEETEFERGKRNPEQAQRLESLMKGAQKKKELNQSLEKNINALKANPDEGFMQVNKALKSEIEALDTLSGQDKEALEKEIRENNKFLEQLRSRTKDPELHKKIEKVSEENKHLLNGLTPHMNAEEKTALAEKISREEDELQDIKKAVTDSIVKSHGRKQSTGPSEELKEIMHSSDAQDELETLQTELSQNEKLHEEMREKITDPVRQEQLQHFSQEAQELRKKLSPDMRPSEKSEAAQTIARDRKVLQGMKNELTGEKTNPDVSSKLKDLAGTARFHGEQETLEKELAKNEKLHDEVEQKSTDPALKEKLEKLAQENHELREKMTPDMRPSEKKELAEKIVREQRTLEELKNDLEGKGEEKPVNWQKILRLVAFIAVAGLAIWFVDRIMKKGVKKARVVPDHVREEIAEELKALKKKKRSPREEVIETYNVLHEGLHLLIFEKETPPSCIVHDELAQSEPTLDKPSFAVTEIYANTFYGERDVSPEDLSTFRKNVKKIFSYFEISA